jgi:glycosyltransferase involved in cell wall biosynthesis
MMREPFKLETMGASPVRRVFYASGGAANIIGAQEAWRSGTQDPTEVSITFSSQIADFCRSIGAEAYFVSPHADARTATLDEFVLEHRPKKGGRALRYHINEIVYSLGLLMTARRFKADLALMDTGATPVFMLALFKLFGIRVVSILHNTLWPAHFPPQRRRDRVLRWLDRIFWRHGAMGAIAVSPECERQVRTEAPRLTYPIIQIRAQFHRDYFGAIPPPPSHEQRPFRVMFIGRVTESKGVFDLLEMAQSLERTDPGRVRWTICGKGDGFDELKARREAMGLEDVVDLAGWVSLEQLKDIYARSHAAIVPTRSGFAEGLAMTAVEAVLAGRPVILNPVVPAIDVVGPAILSGQTNDPESHAEQVRRLARDPALYRRLQEACVGCEAPFYDREQSLTAGLWKLLKACSLLGGAGQTVRFMPMPVPAPVEVRRATRKTAKLS